jgi:hypothetical protein
MCLGTLGSKEGSLALARGHRFRSSYADAKASTFTDLVLIASSFLIAIAPIVWYRHLPLADYPNHLSRRQIHKALPSNPYLTEFFEFH